MIRIDEHQHGIQGARQIVKFKVGSDFESAYRLAEFLFKENRQPVTFNWNGVEMKFPEDGNVQSAWKKYSKA